MLSALAPAMAQTVVNQNVVYQGETTTLEVDSLTGDTYSWELYNDSTVNFATATGTAVADGDATSANLYRLHGMYPESISIK